MLAAFARPLPRGATITATASSGAAACHVTFRRIVNRLSDLISAGPNASANTRHPAAWTKSKPTPLPTYTPSWARLWSL